MSFRCWKDEAERGYPRCRVQCPSCALLPPLPGAVVQMPTPERPVTLVSSDEFEIRNLDLERQFTQEAARGVADPAALIDYCETRAARLSGEYVPNPMLVQRGRDRIQDVREELADARNHLVWWLTHNIGHPDAPDRMIGLRLIILAFERITPEF